MPSLLLPILVLLSLLSLAAAQFNFSLYLYPYGSVECNIAIMLAPVGPAGGKVGVAGDILVWAGSYDGASGIQPTSNTAVLNTSLVPFAIGTNYDGIPPVGQPGCAARTGSSNQLYSIGVNTSVNSQTQFSQLQYYVWVSTDAVDWTNVLDAASQQLFLTRPDDDLTQCGVDLQGNVYDIGSATTYVSTNQGVTWSAVSLSGSRFANRNSFAGGIFTSAITSLDTLIVIAGRASPTPTSTYGGADFNDVSSAVTHGSFAALADTGRAAAMLTVSPSAAVCCPVGVDVVQRRHELDAGVSRCSLGSTRQPELDIQQRCARHLRRLAVGRLGRLLRRRVGQHGRRL